jgi:uncharacterized protein YndB with AHSA1/START domain
MPEIINRVSSEAVRKATGKTWDEWLATLDQEGAGEMPHKEIARLLSDKGYIENAWWCQMVANGYELARGRRVTGETISAGFEIGVRKTYAVSPQKAWELITQPAGMKIWLGNVSKLPLVKGQTYQTEVGTKGEIRSIAPGKRLRLTWQPSDRQTPSTVQVSNDQGGNNTTIGFHQEKLAGEKEREEMRAHWKEVLDKLQELIESSGKV